MSSNHFKYVFFIFSRLLNWIKFTCDFGCRTHVLIYQQLIRAFFKCSNLDSLNMLQFYEDALGCECKLIARRAQYLLSHFVELLDLLLWLHVFVLMIRLKVMMTALALMSGLHDSRTMMLRVTVVKVDCTVNVSWLRCLSKRLLVRPQLMDTGLDWTKTKETKYVIDHRSKFLKGRSIQSLILFSFAKLSIPRMPKQIFK